MKNFQILIGFVLIVGLGAAAFQRNAVWVTMVSLWTDVAGKTPGKSRVRNSLGNSYRLAGRPFAAIDEYREAIRLDPGNIEAYYNLAVNLDNVGFKRLAFPYYDYFCKNASPLFLEETKKQSCDRAGFLLKESGKRQGGASR